MGWNIGNVTNTEKYIKKEWLLPQIKCEEVPKVVHTEK